MSFEESTRILSITDSGESTIATTAQDFLASEGEIIPVGTKVGNVYFTDISANFEGVSLESFNIGGLTCVYADDFAELCGASFIWDEAARTVNIVKKNYRRIIEKKESTRALDVGRTYASKEFSLNRWGEAKNSHIKYNEDGSFTVVEIGEYVNIEKYDSSFNLTESYAIARELPIFGTLYFGKDYNYIAFGQENLREDNSREIIKIVIYDKNFVKISEVPVYNCKTAIPFDAGVAEISEDDKYLVLHASRSQYADEKGVRPQTQLTVIVDKSEWKVCNMLGKFQPNHTSHSLSQHVRMDSDRIVTVDLCDTAPYRGVVLRTLGYDGSVYGTQSIFNAGGPLAANCTGIMTGGIEITPSGYLAAINTIDHSLPTGYDSIQISGIENENRDVYIIWVKRDTWEVKHTCLARYTGLGMTSSVPYLVPLNNGFYAVLWQTYSDLEEGPSYMNTVSCAIVNEYGDLVSDVAKAFPALLSDTCTPIFTGSKIVWYVNTDNGRDFYSIDLASVLPESSANEISDITQKPPIEEEKLPEIPQVEEEPEKTTEKEEEKPRKEILEVDGI